MRRNVPWTPELIFQNSIPEPNTGCWIWEGHIPPDGYPKVSDGNDGGSRLAHRMSFKLANPSIDISDRHIHHKCKLKACVNPSHLSAVTPAEHAALDGLGGDLSGHSERTHCPHGHPYAGDNLIVVRHLSGRDKGTVSRACRVCKRAAKERFEKRRKAKTKEVSNG